jgi:long-chain acyl-CoA synthetase
MTPLENWSFHFQNHPESCALVTPSQHYTRTALLHEAGKRIAHWRAQGLQPGQKILLTGKNRCEYLLAFVAACLGNQEVISVSERATEEELQHVRTLAKPDMEWIHHQDPVLEEAPSAALHFHDIPILFFTSGTTSLPKGVVHRFSKLILNSLAFAQQAKLDATVRMYHVMPTGYMAGLLNTFLSPLAVGGATILGPAFDARSALDFWPQAVSQEVNAMWLSPTMVATLLRTLRDDTIPAWTSQQLRHVFVGTAALHPITRDQFRQRFGVTCLQSYGMTECLFVSVESPQSWEQSLSVGQAIPSVEVRLVRKESEEYPSSECGDLEIRSPFLLEGYVELPKREASVCNPEGWLATGDIATIDATGHIRITGRRKDLIIKGGVNLSPSRIEDALLRIPTIRECAVFGIPDPFWGEVPVACVVPEANAEIVEIELLKVCRNAIGPDHTPTKIHVIAALPRNSNGKVLLNSLREQYA